MHAFLTSTLKGEQSFPLWPHYRRGKACVKHRMGSWVTFGVVQTLWRREMFCYCQGLNRDFSTSSLVTIWI
jgi:hypothetical protein